MDSYVCSININSESIIIMSYFLCDRLDPDRFWYAFITQK